MDEDRKDPYRLDDELSSPTISPVSSPRFTRLDNVYKKPDPYGIDDDIALPRYPGRDNQRQKPSPYALREDMV